MHSKLELVVELEANNYHYLNLMEEKYKNIIDRNFLCFCFRMISLVQQ